VVLNINTQALSQRRGCELWQGSSGNERFWGGCRKPLLKPGL